MPTVRLQWRSWNEVHPPVRVLEVLRAIAEEGNTTMMLVTHEMGFAREVADRVVMFDNGQILESGPPSQILDAPREERTQSFLGAVFDH